MAATKSYHCKKSCNCKIKVPVARCKLKMQDKKYNFMIKAVIAR